MKELGATTSDDMFNLIDMYIKKPKELSSKEITKDFDFASWIFEAIEMRVVDKNPKKYDLVKKYITNTTKKDFVNHFWMFHANSNFQKIRWKLLTDGFMDNVNLSESTYKR